MDYTETYHLPQWAESDRIMMEDFNQMCRDMETGLTASQREAAQKGFVIGSYTGDGKKMDQGGQVIRLGFRPRFLIITRGWVSSSSISKYYLVVGEHTDITNQDWCFAWEDDGFRVAFYSSGVQELNVSGLAYDYIAFR